MGESFKIVVDVRSPKFSNNFKIPTGSGKYNYNVKWNKIDKSITDKIFNRYQGEEKNIIDDYVINMDEPGVYRVEIDGQIPHITYSNDDDAEKIIAIDQWGDNKWDNMSGMFQGAHRLEYYYATDTPDLSNVTDMSHMFESTVRFNSHLGGDNKHIQNINLWDTSNIKDMSYMFANSWFNVSLNRWDTSNVVNMKGMFLDARYNGNITNWDTSNVKDMTYMFSGNYGFKQDIGDWNTSNVINMKGMFDTATHFNIDISEWDVSNVENMKHMFNNARLFDKDISNWNVRKISRKPEGFDSGSGIEGKTSKQPNWNDN